MCNCIICGKDFNKNVHNQLCCSKECKKEYLKKYDKEYRQRPNIKEYLKEYQKERKEYFKEYYRRSNVKNHRKELRKTSKYKEIGKKIIHKRQRNLGWNPLNEYFNDSEGHHINRIDVIYIPIDYHFRGHSVTRNKNMEPINTIAFFFLLMQNIDKIKKITCINKK